MPHPKRRNPPGEGGLRGHFDKLVDARESSERGCRYQDRRTPRRCRLAKHLYACGPRPVLEALLLVADGADLDAVLADFARVPADYFHILGAAHLDVEPALDVLDGART